ncbi:hypothetical protein [Marinilabilia rubra]|uniref:Zinc-finger domain-containing protein n=1 Tax=Marinilabilia rubra TaxID=2162893 RepID=A0A2U2B8Z2_9BACT|nr:hypothetical protein [Marinilabilia rubra]PWD99513.1 hypothetical protein DDZ16_10955 [Marinilabilia rubra]
MKCNDFNNKLAFREPLKDVTSEMHQHIETCASCMEAFKKTKALFAFIEEEKQVSVSPYINTRIRVQIENQRTRPKMIRPVFVTVMSVILVILGFFSAELFQNQSNMFDSAEIIASEYYFSDNPGTQLEEIWINTYQDE